MEPPDCGPETSGRGMPGVGDALKDPGGRGAASPAGGGSGPLATACEAGAAQRTGAAAWEAWRPQVRELLLLLLLPLPALPSPAFSRPAASW